MAEQAQEMVTDATPEKKAFMAKRSTHEDRIKKDEEELQQLLKEQTGDEEQEENKDSIEEKEEPKNAEERTFKKRYGDLRRHSQEKEKEYQKRLKDLESQLDNATKKEMKLPKSDEDLEAQPKWIQDALYENENDARAAGRAIDLYKADRNIGKKDTSKDDKSAAKAINTKSKKTEVDVTETSKKIRESDVQRMSADQYEKNADMIMEAIRSGNFLYDISGSAR